MKLLGFQGKVSCGQDVPYWPLQQLACRGQHSRQARSSCGKQCRRDQQLRTVICSAAQAVQASPRKDTATVTKPSGQGATKIVFWSQQGKRVVAAVEKVKDGFRVHVTIEDAATDLQISWGLYRTSAAKWQLFAVPVGMGLGDPRTLGPTLSAVEGATCSVNFALRSRHASAMSLCLARRIEAPTSNGSSGTAGAAQPGKGYLELALDPEVNRTGDVWHVCLQGLRDVGTLCYGWRAESTLGSDFVPGQVMLDPQAPLATHVQLPRGVHMSARTGRSAARPSHDAPALMGSLAFLLDDFAFGWDHQRPSLPLQNTVVLEADIPSFSTGPASRGAIPSEHQGKILGVLDRLGDIRALGANVVMLSSPCLAGEGDGPFSRVPFSFFAPEAAWATGKDALAPMRELKQVVQGLQEKGLEVWLQVQFCFTAEGNEDEGCTVCLRGLDAPIYYRQRGVLNCGHAVVRQLVVDALVHWRQEYRVDGFVFVNAETLALDRNGNVLDNPPLAETIAAEPLLADVRLVAWPGDIRLLPRGGQRGFPHWGRWMERNLRAGSDLLRFLGPFNGADDEAEGQSRASALATRLTGSADMFAAQFDEGLPGSLAVSRLPGCGLNGISILSKASLRDTVAELVPGHEGLQGGPHALRTTLTKTLLMATVLMLGTPILTQEVMEDPALARFAGVLVRTRRRLGELLSPRDFVCPRTIAWHGASAGSQPDWDGSALAAHVPGAAFMGLSATLPKSEAKAFYLGLNGHEHAVEAALPSPPAACEWRRVVDSAREAPDDAVLDRAGAKLESQESYWVNGKAGVLVVAAPLSRVSAPGSAASREVQRQATPSSMPA
ncbi:hypothetical protein WJX73_001102 [Symbiochloris irregularis]|uniref:Isoamylase 1-3-like C-terminal domain-containing protein n=1 Tax=Symbiochloris irregularis TaxID=706552 RepID=A0AAW1PIN2_9CHLO